MGVVARSVDRPTDTNVSAHARTRQHKNNTQNKQHAQDFDPACEIVVDQINNAVMLKKKPPAASTASSDKKEYIHPTDRNRKAIPKR